MIEEENKESFMNESEVISLENNKVSHKRKEKLHDTSNEIKRLENKVNDLEIQLCEKQIKITELNRCIFEQQCEINRINITRKLYPKLSLNNSVVNDEK